MLIGLLGKKLSGKDTAARFLVERFGASHYKISGLLDEVLSTLNLSLSRENEIALGNSLRSTFGSKVIMDAIVYKIQKDKNPFKIVSGVRLPDEFKAISNLGGKLIYITCPDHIRYERYVTRNGRPDDGSLSFEHFLEEDKQGLTEKFISELGARADAEIMNNGDINDFYRNLNLLINSLQ